jgi:hypothetical protein
MALTDKLTMGEMLMLRKMPRDDAVEHIKHLKLTPEEEEQAMRLISQSLVDPYLDNRLWAATAHLLGASFRQIALDKGVSPQSVYNQVARLIPFNRASYRLAKSISLESMSQYKVAFFENIDFLRTKSPEEAAVWLTASVDLDV